MVERDDDSFSSRSIVDRLDEHARRQRAEIRRLQQLPRECTSCHQEKVAGEFPVPRDDNFEIPTECLACRKQRRVSEFWRERQVSRPCRYCLVNKEAADFPPGEDGDDGIPTHFFECHACLERKAQVLEQQQLPRKCMKCREVKEAEEFPKDEDDEYPSVPRECNVCVEKASKLIKQKRENEAIDNALFARRRGYSFYDYHPTRDKLSFLTKTEMRSGVDHLSGVYNLVFFRGMLGEKVGMAITRATIHGRIELNQNQHTGSFSGQISIDCPLPEPLMSDRFDFIQSEGPGKHDTNERTTAAENGNSDWSAEIIIPNYVRDDDSDHEEEEEEERNPLRPFVPKGEIKVIAARHACPWLPRENEYLCEYSYEKSEFLSFKDVAEGEAAVARSGEYNSSWLCRHLDIPSSVARQIHQYVAWRPQPAFFFEKGDLWIRTEAKWDTDDGPLSGDCYFIARRLDGFCNNYVESEKRLQAALQARYDVTLISCSSCRDLHPRPHYGIFRGREQAICDSCRSIKNVIQHIKDDTIHYTSPNVRDMNFLGANQCGIDLAGEYDVIFHHRHDDYSSICQCKLSLQRGGSGSQGRVILFEKYYDDVTSIEFLETTISTSGDYRLGFRVNEAVIETAIETEECRGHISVLAYRVALPYGSGDAVSFGSVEEAEALVAAQKSKCSPQFSWIANHLSIPVEPAHLIHSFVAWERPAPAFFFEKGDLFLNYGPGTDEDDHNSYLVARRAT